MYTSAHPAGHSQVAGRLIEGRVDPPDVGPLKLHCQLTADNVPLCDLVILFNEYPWGAYPNLDDNHVFTTDKLILEEYRRHIETGLYLSF